MIAPRPDTRPPRVRAAEFAASRWTIASGARLHVHLDDDHARVEIAVLRDSLGGPPSFPSLVDHHLVWLILDLAAEPDELILTQTLRGFTSITTTYHHPRSEALTRYADRIAAATRAFATAPPLPDLRDIDAGRGAWREAARRAAATACHWCHYRLGSNLDCPACKATHHRDPDAAWSTSKIAAALHGCIDHFGDPLYRQAADAARRALASITDFDRLSRDFFDEWAARFAWHTADIFAAPAHRRLARERIEAQMLDPSFALPKHERPRTLAVPPAPSPADELAAQLRALRQRLHDDGIPKPEAHRRIRTHQCIRRLVAAIAELYGADALLAGDLLAPAVVIYRDGHPVLRHVTTLLGERTYAVPELHIDDRLAIERRLADLRARLVDAVRKANLTCIRDDDGQAIDLALQRLRAHTPPMAAAADTVDRPPRRPRKTEPEITTSDPPPPEPAAEPPERIGPTEESAPVEGQRTVTTLTLTADQRLWLLDLLAGFVEDHDVNADDTDPTPPPANVEWARALADHLFAEIAALADHPPP